MRIALISDIHGNLIALDAVLVELKQNKVKHIVCLGDVAATGPQPHETLRRLETVGASVVMGNKDQLLLGEISPRKNTQDEDMRKINEIDIWCRSELTPEDIEYMRSFRKTVSLPLGYGENLFCFHGSPVSNLHLITSKTPDEELQVMLSGSESQSMAGGHSHVQMLRQHGSIRLVNPGSVGQAIERVSGSDAVRHLPWAEYAVVESDETGFPLKVEFFRKKYDRSELLSTARSSGMPHFEWWAKRSE